MATADAAPAPSLRGLLARWRGLGRPARLRVLLVSLAVLSVLLRDLLLLAVSVALLGFAEVAQASRPKPAATP